MILFARLDTRGVTNHRNEDSCREQLPGTEDHHLIFDVDVLDYRTLRDSTNTKATMVEIIDIPFVKPLAEWAWGPEEAPICLSELPLLGMACFSQLLAKAFGIVIIVASMLNKIPIMKNMMSSQSAAGISRNALYGEAMVYANCAMYGLLSGHPFTA